MRVLMAAAAMALAMEAAHGATADAVAFFFAGQGQV